MGELFAIDYTVIYMKHFDTDRHMDPHFHVKILNTDQKASISILSKTIIAGNIDKYTLKLIQTWIMIHQEELIANWNRAVIGKEIYSINPKFRL
ncbi:DUF4160 domain-containing protein [Clostridium sp. FP2]|uniref:DUF4160 domain-containing protein n=1 Tax=Clostridium sp. FP2 TaxID=2724481 RepID=UPI0013E8FDD0|nr:DUF4160 domain-containing protein [Clostridium sp. FP2]MBZ9621434.1 DUF4160 domain-containing protein [Clostridium sp. FP2]